MNLKLIRNIGNFDKLKGIPNRYYLYILYNQKIEAIVFQIFIERKLPNNGGQRLGKCISRLGPVQSGMYSCICNAVCKL